MKKKYQKPAMRVVKLQHRTHLLAGSGISGYDDDFGYIPGIGNDRNHLA